MRRPLSALILSGLLSATALTAMAEPLTLTSPAGTVAVTLDQDGQGRLTYQVNYAGTAILAPSPLGLRLADTGALSGGLAVTGNSRRSVDQNYTLPVGKVSSARDHFNEITVSLAEQAGGKDRKLDVIVRAYDDGVALRYRLPAQPSLPELRLRAELTAFNFAGDFGCWGLNLGHYGSSHEGEFDPVQASRLRPHNRFEAPLVCRTGSDGPAFALTEADLRDYAGMYLSGQDDGTLGAQVVLSPRLDDPKLAVRRPIPADGALSPWRVILLARHPGALNESNLITALNPETAIKDTSWIKPGKAAWDWWNGWIKPGSGKVQANDDTTRAFIDFAAANGFPYMLVDDGWYLNSGGGGTVLPGADLMRTAPGFDLPSLVAYGAKKKVGLFLWMHWRSLDERMDAVMEHYARLGVKGIKVDFMDRDDQQMVDYYHRLLSTAAKHKLLVDLHGAYHPTGLIRTYPHYLTQEGVLGAEYNKWTTRITASHNVMLAYTRLLTGPMDYTPGGFRNVAPADFKPQNHLPLVQTTRAHGLAQYVVYDSPFACVSDNPDAYQGQDGLDIIRAVPVSWDEVRFLGGEVGDYIALARRKGDEWFIGVLNNETARKITLPLTLPTGRYKAEIVTDGNSPTTLSRQSTTLTAGSPLSLDLAASGGAVVRLTPVK